MPGSSPASLCSETGLELEKDHHVSPPEWDLKSPFSPLARRHISGMTESPRGGINGGMALSAPFALSAISQDQTFGLVSVHLVFKVYTASLFKNSEKTLHQTLHLMVPLYNWEIFVYWHCPQTHFHSYQLAHVVLYVY